MTDSAIADLIREVLAEELAKIGGRPALAGNTAASGPKEERVSIGGDADLTALVRRVLALADNPAERKAFEDGRLVFRLAGNDKAGQASQAARQAPANGVSVASGVLTERRIDGLPGDTAVLSVGKAVRVTPLAKDRLRQRGIRLERTEQ